MKKIFSILALALAAMTASAEAGFDLTVGKSEKGKIAFLVGGSEVKSAPEGAAVTMEITPQGGYVVKEVTNSLYTDWNSARAASTIDITTSVEMKKVTDNVYTFTMPRACVEVNVTYDIEIPTPAEDQKDEEKEVTDVKLDMEPAGAPETVGEITIIPVSITGIEVPQTAPQEIVIKVEPSTQVGNNVFVVREIKAGAFKTNDENVKVTKVILPDTEEPLTVEAGAMKPNGKPIDVQTPLALLDDYAVAAALKDNFEGKKISAVAAAPNRYWTFSCGVDVVVPEGVTVYGAYNREGAIRILPIDEVNSSKIIKANNGVIMACTSGKGGEKYQMVASPTGPKTGEKLAEAKTDANSYAGNCMAPTTQAANYDASEILILKDNEFHTIASSTTDKVPACKAVYSFSK